MTRAGRDAELLARVLEAVPGGVLHVSGSGAILRANRTAREFLGLALDPQTGRLTTDLAGRTVFEDGAPCPESAWPVTRCLATGRPQPPTVLGITQTSGDLRWAVFTAVPGPDGGAVVTFVDITERLERERAERQMREKLVLSERLASIGALAAGIAHEINNPLTYAIGNLDLLATRLATADPETRRLVDDALDGVGRVAEIVRGLRDLARKDLDDNAPFDLADAVEVSLRMVRSDLRAHSLVAVDLAHTGAAWGHHGRTVQVLINLLANAVQALPPTPTETPAIRIRSRDAGPTIVLDVEDDGAGMPEAVLRRALDPFFTTKPAGIGTGLGLSISRSLIEAMGGTLSVTSTPGRGTTVTIRLGRADATAPAPTPAPATEAAGLTVLVVDDEPAILSLCRELLGRSNRVLSAMDGVEALEILDREPVDVILCDLIMPRMTGMAFYRQLTRARPDLADRVVFTTGAALGDEARRFLARVERPCLNKPFRLSRLSAILAEAARG